MGQRFNFQSKHSRSSRFIPGKRYRKSLQQIMKQEKDQIKKGIKKLKQKTNANLRDDFYFEKIL